MLITFLLAFLFVTQAVISDSTDQYESEIRVAPPQCLLLFSSHRAGGNTWILKFQNVCGKRLYANACIEERPGEYRLHKSGAKIPKYGYWTLYSYEGYEPLSVHVATGSGVPGIPGPCELKNR